MMKKLFFVIALFSGLICHSQESNPFYVGHSLVNFDMPAMVQGLAEDAGKTTHYGNQIGIGAPLTWNYNNHASTQGTAYVDAFPNGNFNTLIITEAVPLQGHLTWSDTDGYADSFYNYAKSNNNNNPIKFYIYETWHCTNSGIPSSEPNAENGCMWDNTANSTTLWHPRLLQDLPLWSSIVTHVRDENPSDSEIWMVPAGQAFYHLASEINAGNVPGITNVTDLFSDDIHLTNAGNYFVACVMYATVYRESPVGLTQNVNNQWGTPFTSMPTSSQALIMQEVAWATVTSLSSLTGVSSAILPVDWAEKTEARFIKNEAKITFATSQQVNNSHFEIEHSQEGRIFKKIGELQGAGNSSRKIDYEFTHKHPYTGINFYRVKQVDRDGNYSYGNLAYAVHTSSETTIYPNPVVGDLRINSATEDIIYIYNHLGQQVLRKSVEKGLNEVDLTNLDVGIYNVRFDSGIIKRILKQ